MCPRASRVPHAGLMMGAYFCSTVKSVIRFHFFIRKLLYELTFHKCRNDRQETNTDTATNLTRKKNLLSQNKNKTRNLSHLYVLVKTDVS